MANIDQELNGVGFSQAQVRTLTKVLDDIQADLDNIRSAITTLTAKMDTDFTGQNGAVTDSELDTDYASNVDPAALNTTT